jgi:glycosyltransferase involved in cell wall biosynthesis
MNKRLNVLFLSSWYPCRSNLYNGNFVQRHAEAVAIYASVHVLFACSDKNLKSVETEHFVKNGVDTHIIYYPKIKSKIPLLDNMLKYIYLKKLYLKNYIKLKNTIGKIDIIHINVIYPIGLIARYLKRKFNIPYVITEHWTGYLPQNQGKLSSFVKQQSRKIVSAASVVMPVSDNLQKSMQELGFKADYNLIPNVVDTKLFGLKEEAYKPLRFIHVSTLIDKHKNISGILHTIKQLSKKRKDFTFTIIGDGDIKPHIRYAEQLEIPKEIITFEGAKPIEKIAEAMQKSDIFVLFSNYENLPCVISEAHSCGLPVISTNVGGISEMIDDLNGILISVKDENTLLEKMEHMLNEFDSYKPDKIRKKAIKRYAYDKVGKQIVAVYNKVLKIN